MNFPLPVNVPYDRLYDLLVSSPSAGFCPELCDEIPALEASSGWSSELLGQCQGLGSVSAANYDGFGRSSQDTEGAAVSCGKSGELQTSRLPDAERPLIRRSGVIRLEYEGKFACKPLTGGVLA